MNTVRTLLESSITGNIIGFLSLIVGILGLIVTVTTMKSAKVIQEEVKKKGSPG